MNKNFSSLRKKRWLKILVTGAVLILLATSAYAFRAPILTGVANYLIVKDELHPADIIFVLNGDNDTRPFYATDLYQQGLAPLVVIARSENGNTVSLGLVPNVTDIAIGVMEKKGIPAGKIVQLTSIEGGVTSTFDEAISLRQYIETHPVSRVILVTSAFHTRRARWVFERELKGHSVTIEMAAVPYQTFDATNWWKNEDGLITLNNEYIKLVFYLLKYH